jgi:hypothetical protein
MTEDYNVNLFLNCPESYASASSHPLEKDLFEFGMSNNLLELFYPKGPGEIIDPDIIMDKLSFFEVL